MGKPTKVVYNLSEEGKVAKNDPIQKELAFGVQMNPLVRANQKRIRMNPGSSELVKCKVDLIPAKKKRKIVFERGFARTPLFPPCHPLASQKSRLLCFEARFEDENGGYFTNPTGIR